MKKVLGMLIAASVLSVTACATDGSQAAKTTAPTLTVEERVIVNAPASTVWTKVNNFGDLGAWHPAVAKTEITSGTNNQMDAVRLLTLQDGGTIVETLKAYSHANMYYSYVINEGVLPVSNYASTIRVFARGENSAEVVWIGNFNRKDLSANPAKGADDKTASDTMHAVYRGGLDNLKKITE